MTPPPNTGSFQPYEKLFEQMADEWPIMRDDITEIKVEVAGIKGEAVGTARAWAVGISAITLLLAIAGFVLTT